MCGICGFAGVTTEHLGKESLEEMLKVIRHRGPDEKGTYFTKNAALGCHRLSITGVRNGTQPVHNETGNIRAVFNGELYNFEDLKKKLLEKGHDFYSSSDTEIIVHLYEEYGEDFVSHISGMFAIAVWDENNKKLVLARDRLGVKPLYYAVRNNTVIFASEIKSLLKNTLVETGLNYQKLPSFLAFSYIPGEQTLFNNIYKLMPGHMLTCSGRNAEIKQFWKLDYRENYIREDEFFYAKTVYSLVTDSIRSMLKSETRPGVFLSGGLDSGIVLSEAAKLGGKIKTFSVGFEKPGKNVDRKEYDELEQARQAARYYGSEHYEYVINPKDVIDDIHKIIWHLDEPLPDPTAIPLYYLAKLARQHVKSVLSGEGADEIFAGYRIYREPKVVNRYRLLPEVIRREIIEAPLSFLPFSYGKDFIRRAGMPLLKRYKGVGATFRNDEISSLLNGDLRNAIRTEENDRYVLSVIDEIRGGKDEINQMLYFDQKIWLPEDVLMKSDKISMAHALEMRVPFLGHKVVEFAARIPSKFKYRGNCEKYILRQSFKTELPEFIYKKPKNQFPVPISALIEGEYRKFAKDILLSQKALNRNYFNKSYVEGLFCARRKKNLFDRQIWLLLIFELWHRTYLI